MRRRIAILLLVIFACSAAGIAVALLNLRKTTATLGAIIELHEIEALRRHLVIAVRAAQSDLYTIGTPLGQTLDAIIDNVAGLEAEAGKCTGCHHAPPVAARLDRLQRLVPEYERALSYYITVSGNQARIRELKLAAAEVSNQLLELTADMSLQASGALRGTTAAAKARTDAARTILWISLVITFLVALVVAVRLASSVTRPITRLVEATRAVAAGDLGHSVTLEGGAEFAELAANFNSMTTALREAERQLVHDAFHDALTGLANRALLVNRLRQVLASCRRRPDERYAVVFLDLDRFKVINDSLGHVVGDHLLVAMGRRLAACLRETDTLARLGGDEFAALLTDFRDPTTPLQVIERFRRELSRAFDVDGHEIFVTASMGVALRSERHEQPEHVLRDADIAMYQARSRGLPYEIFDAEMHGRVVERLRLEADLRRAAERGEEFVLHYQPIVDLRAPGLLGFEALVRWNDPVRGLVEPAAFIPIAEESGMIVGIGEWVARHACAQLRAWRDVHPSLGDAGISLNLSARHFRERDVVARLAGIIGDAGLNPDDVTLELTESVIMDDVAESAAKLARLRDLGLEIHVDDFGTGYSSLSYLHRFPITAVKIDRSFVSELGGDGETEELIGAIVTIARSLRFDVIAEGVERAVQAEKLRELRCDFAQGFHFARPMESDAAAAWATAPGRGAPGR